MGASFNGKAYEEVYKHGTWQETAEKYEQAFAAKLYKTPYVQEAAKTALTKLSTMLNAYYNDQGQAQSLNERTVQDIEAARQASAEITGELVRDPADVQPEDVQPADGGNDKMKNEENLNAETNGDGDLRERMLLLYNGMLGNGGESREEIAGSRSLKNMMAYITEDRQKGIPELQDVRIDLLEEMRQRKKRGDVFDTYFLARDLKKASDKKDGRGNWLTRFFQGIHRGFSATMSGRFTRKRRSKEERQFNAQGMLQTAGPSGTALRMLGAYKLMGASLKDLLYFRLALIAWMVTSKDYSLYEIMKDSQNAGITGKEDLSEPATMYMTVDPIPVDVLRQEFAPERQFPHELVYKTMLNELAVKRRENAQNKQIKDWEKNTYALFGADYVTLWDPSYIKKFSGETAMNTEAQELALNIYTTGAYLAMTRGQKYGSGIAKRALSDGSNANLEVYENAFSGELKNSEIKNSIFNMVRISSRMVQDALEERGQLKENAYGSRITQFAYRSQRLTGDLKAGENSEITLRSLTKSSKDIERANELYMESQKRDGINHTVMVEYKMHGKGAVDISGSSRNREEKEVLIPANTKFKVVKPLRKAGITYQGIAWNRREEPDREERQFLELAYGYAICLEEVEGPGSVKREETGEIAEERRKIREDYQQRLQELRRQQEEKKGG